MEDRLYPKHPIVGVGAIVLWDNKILLVKRGNEPYKGFWAVPGGVQEVGETLEEAVLRELREEAGISGIVEGILWIDEIIERDRFGVKYHYIIIDVLVKPIGINVRPGSDVSDANWFTLDEALKLKTTDTMRKFLLFLKKHGLSRVLPYTKAVIINHGGVK